MISCDKGVVSFEGTRAHLMAELTTLMSALIQDNVVDEKELELCVAMATRSPEEIKQEIKKAIDRELEQLLGMMGIKVRSKDNVQDMMDIVNQIKKEKEEQD